MTPHHPVLPLWIAKDEQITCPELLDQYKLMLSDEERAHYLRFIYDGHRHQYLVTRALVRCTLSRYCPDIAPHQWQFKKSRFGKPAIVNRLNAPLYFNLSHTKGAVVLAVNYVGEVGVDIEWIQRREKITDIATRYFTQHEIKTLQAMDPVTQRHHFYQLWTLKEAYIKACGQGMSLPLNQFYFQFLKQRIHVCHTKPSSLVSENYHFLQFQMGTEYQGALAIQCTTGDFSSPAIQCRHVVPLRTEQNDTHIELSR
ncbi:4'-phosphopantetheinyl transferase family protein [Pseudoalteromonas luteoviolacea]|uniref:4'-phosphopantetheinyl transferase family protein n=1 Tax=Pseudoalteromonas luteoviolacea TaxID=43657 RepID=UPI001B39AAA0|nr:4'-phosphopantetheinyl transferase superfamily protein [Pseudoalteromonas luteoviolacea]MBQ4839736.1 4'-phosphopantetheinyl transferase superfamily protein [Pseudoalteromonas luteoviolacea]